MRIKDLYKKYQIPPNLQDHMYRVAGMAKIILTHWKGPKIDAKLILTACLIHDMGNILKFDLVNHANFLGEEEKNVEFWKAKKAEMAEKYGPDEHLATEKIVKEIGVSQPMFRLISNWGFRSNDRIFASRNWPPKICNYSDHRIGPWGVVTLEDRFREQRERYGKNWELSIDRKAHLSDRRPILIEAAFGIEKQLQEKVNRDLNKISTLEVEKERAAFENWEV